MASIKKIAIFGASGMTGLCALDYAVSSGLKVRALLRPGTELPSKFVNKVEIVRGDALDNAAVRDTISSTDGVVYALGTRHNVCATTLMSAGLKNVLQAMSELGVKPISVCMTAFLFVPPSVVPPIFRVITEDHERMLDLILRSDANFVAVFPPHIADEPASEFEVAENRLPGRKVVSKLDLGKFLVTSISKPSNYRKVFGISSPEK